MTSNLRDLQAALPDLPFDDDGPVFGEPWQAQAFAMTLALHERGVFTWTEWARTLSEAIRDAQASGDPDRGDTYYAHWLDALERICTAVYRIDGEPGIDMTVDVPSQDVAALLRRHGVQSVRPRVA